MSDTTARFACAACNKSYRWKPELAGRKVKCTCSHVMIAPKEPPAAPDDDLIPLADETDTSTAARSAVDKPTADLAHTVMGHQILAATAVGAPAITADPPAKRPAPKPKPVAAPKPAARDAKSATVSARVEPRSGGFKWWHAAIAVAVVLGVAIYLILSRG